MYTQIFYTVVTFYTNKIIEFIYKFHELHFTRKQIIQI